MESPMTASLLLVEDDASLAGITRRFLIQAGHKVTLAVSGEEALSLIQRNKPDLIVSDVQLPGLSGLKLCELLKENKETKRKKVEKHKKNITFSCRRTQPLHQTACSDRKINVS